MMLHEALVRLKCPALRIEPIRTRVQHAAKHSAIDSPIAAG